MTTAPMPDPFEEDWTPELKEEVRASFDGLPFELLSDDLIESQVEEFRSRLSDSPYGDDPFETW